MKRLVVIFFILQSAGSLMAQYDSRLGRFQVSEIRGCSPLTVTILNTKSIAAGDCTSPNTCVMDFGNGTVQGNQFTITYTTPGRYLLRIAFQSQPVDPFDDIEINVEPNIQPAYEVYTCSGSKVSIKVTEQIYDQYFIDFGDGSPILPIAKSANQVAQYSYGAAGNYTILVNGKKNQAANNCAAKPISFAAVAVVPSPAITTLTAVDEVSARLDFAKPVNVQYKLEMATNGVGFVQLQSLYDVATVTTNNLRVDNNFYCFRLSAYDPCNFQNNYSPVICTQKVTLTPQNNQHKLDWQTHTGATQIASVDINRESIFYQSRGGATLSFIDPDVVCNTNYCYQIISKYAWGGNSFSLPKCGVAISTTIPSTILNSSADVGGAGVQLSWLQPPLFTAVEYSIQKVIGTGNYLFYDKAAVPNYTDAGFLLNDAQCYKINYVDKCNNRSANSIPICPIQLKGSLNAENEVSLSWNAYSGWSQGVKNYVIEKYDQSDNLISTTDIGLNLSFSESRVDLDNQIVSFKIIAKPNQLGLTESISNKVRLTKSVNLFFPTAFTPDRKGPVANETFTVRGQFITKLELSIFDRWGALVFYSDKDEPWDGFQNGQLMPISTYVWTANFTDLSGKTYKKSGTVLLMRK